MKTAVSLPNDLFRRAEVAAKKLRISRSALYAQAISDFLAHSDPELVTERLNALYSPTPARIDPDIMRAQIRSLKNVEW
jgi:metal-responsive CopG/Arc/MetJ family transcriptional regulator